MEFSGRERAHVAQCLLPGIRACTDSGVVHQEEGLFRSAIGRLRPGIETSIEPTLSEDDAIDAALTVLDSESRPWETDPSIAPPTTELMLREPPGQSDLALVWRVDLSGGQRLTM